MYKQISLVFANYLIKKDMGKQEYIEIYTYGFENIISTVINSILLLFVGLMSNLTVELIAYMIFYGILRIHSGGYHKKTHASCIITYILLAIIHINGIKYLIDNNYMLSSLLIFCYLFSAVILIFLYAPVDSKNKRLNEANRAIQKQKSRKTIIMQAVIIIFAGYFYQQEWLALVASIAVFTQCITLLPIWNQRKGEVLQHEEN